ncbi:MAG: AMP-binding protein, partial [Dehalococcoidales bacterium]|nr:AMP-binding protein [Dehalococcoidales bacterium]
FISYPTIMARQDIPGVQVNPDPEDVVNIAYSSSSSIHPRGTMLTHRNLITEAAISADMFRQTSEDVLILFALPMHHLIGLVAVMLAAVSRGSEVVIIPGISITSLMEIMEREQATILIGVPYIYALAVNTAEKDGIKHDMSSLRVCGSGGAPLPINTIRRFKKCFGLDILNFYGQTEAVCHVTCAALDGSGKLGAAGKAMPGWEMKIVDDNGHELAPNQPGEIILRGPITVGYFNNPRATQEIIRDGWLYTGDLGIIDEDGELFVTGRKKNMIIVRGQNIYPEDIESVLSQHPKVAWTRVVGVPDALRGEVVRAAVHLRQGEAATEEELRRFCREHMADYKVPKQIVFLGSLPRTVSGKSGEQELRNYLSTLPYQAA